MTSLETSTTLKATKWYETAYSHDSGHMWTTDLLLMHSGLKNPYPLRQSQ